MIVISMETYLELRFYGSYRMKVISIDTHLELCVDGGEAGLEGAHVG